MDGHKGSDALDLLSQATNSQPNDLDVIGL